MTVICGTCEGNHDRKTPCWNRDLWLPQICSLLMTCVETIYFTN